MKWFKNKKFNQDRKSPTSPTSYTEQQQLFGKKRTKVQVLIGKRQP
jgi:hypothetical protein